MNWEAIGAIGEILGALGVIGTLFYLALQIRQNTRSNESNRINEIAREFSERHTLIATSAEMPKLAAKCRDADSEFSVEEEERKLAWVNSIANTYVSVHVAHQSGEMSDELYEAYCQDLYRFIQMYPATIPEWHLVCDHYPLLKTYKVFRPLFDGTFPLST
jgi:hypothetical protein